MDTIFKAIITGLASIFLLAGGFSVILGVMGVVNASQFFESVTNVIVESNYNQDVIDDCCDEAESYGYKLQVTVYGGTVPGTQQYADIRFTYTFDIDLISFSKEQFRQKVV